MLRITCMHLSKTTGFNRDEWVLQSPVNAMGLEWVDQAFNAKISSTNLYY